VQSIGGEHCFGALTTFKLFDGDELILLPLESASLERGFPFLLTFNAVAGQAIPSLISGVLSLRILSLHSPITSTAFLQYLTEAN
jgi:hypothetical protein